MENQIPRLSTVWEHSLTTILLHDPTTEAGRTLPYQGVHSLLDQEELFKEKETFMFSVFNANLLTDMDKRIFWKHLNTTDAQAVW